MAVTYDTSFLTALTGSGLSYIAGNTILLDAHADIPLPPDGLNPGDHFFINGTTELIYVGVVPSVPGGYIATLGGSPFLFSNDNTIPIGTNINGVADPLFICFMPGTLIRTPDGDQPVETFKPGDLVITWEGNAVPVRWVGRQTVSRIFADPLRILPIRIRAGALDDYMPIRDLLISPDHAVLIDDILVQAGVLVNGTSIVRETDVPETFTYYHLELDDHSLILAEGVPAETFVDNVDRLAFDNWAEHEALYPNGKMVIEMPYPRAKAARQLPKRIKLRLEARAARLYEAIPAVA